MKTALAEKEQWFREVVGFSKEKIEWRWEVEYPTFFLARQARSAGRLISASSKKAIGGPAMVSMMRWVRAVVLLGAFCIAVPKAGLISSNAVMAAERDGAIAAEAEQSKTVGGLTVYVGVFPAEVIKGPPAHVLVSKGPHDYDILSKSPHEYEIVAGIFDASGTRVSDAVVTAQVSGLGLSGNREQLAPMQIAGSAAYGGFVDLPESDLYAVSLTVQRPGAAPVVLEFKYDHRR